MKRDIEKLISGIFLFAFSAGLLFLAAGHRHFADFYTHHIYPVLVGTLGRVSCVFPFSLTEAALYLLVILLLIRTVRDLLKLRILSIVSGLFFTAALLFTVYVLCCGINYRASAFSEITGMETGAYGKEELTKLTGILAEMVNENTLSHEKEGRVSGIERYDESWREAGRQAMENLGVEYPMLSGYYPLPKPLFVSRLLSVQQVTGVYSPFFIEAIYNAEMPDYNIPHTICHELSHLKGFMREDEANFIGFLACIGSDDESFRYSGYLTAFVYAGNALAKADPASYGELKASLSAEALFDLADNNIFWARFDGGISETQTAVNDAYLKSSGQPEGVLTYDRFTDLLIEYYGLRKKN